MGFSICATDLRWIDGSKDDPKDLCLHGHAVVLIGNNKLEYDATVSATALYLLKTLTENHIINTDNQLLPCCGFMMVANDTQDSVTIVGCNSGIDWSVIHDGDGVILELEDGTRERIPIDSYRKEVFAFADCVEAFYINCTPKILPEDKYDRAGYTAFWNEWHRRRNKFNGEDSERD